MGGQCLVDIIVWNASVELSLSFSVSLSVSVSDLRFVPLGAIVAMASLKALVRADRLAHFLLKPSGSLSSVPFSFSSLSATGGDSGSFFVTVVVFSALTFLCSPLSMVPKGLCAQDATWDLETAARVGSHLLKWGCVFPTCVEHRKHPNANQTKGTD